MGKVKAIKISRIFSIVLAIAILIHTPVFAAVSEVQSNNNPITVELYGKLLEFDVQPQIINGQTMVPLRTIFEAVGLEVGWDPNIKQITGIKNGVKIILTVGKKEAYINDKLEILDAPPVIVGGRTLVPVRFIAEAIGLDVEWEQATKTVKIDKLPQVIVHKESNREFISGYYKDNYLKLTSNGTTLVVEGKIKDAVKWILSLYDKEGNRVLDNYPKFPFNASFEDIKKWIESSSHDNITTNGSFKDTMDLSSLEGQYTINLFVNFDINSDTLIGYYTNIPITIYKSSITFDFPPTYVGNYNKALEASKLNPKNYLSLDHIKESERKVLVDLAKQITKGLENDYDKLLAIHNWVADNIYYDYDAYARGIYGKADAYSTYESKKSVCQGYAELTLALCRAVGIPTRLVSGYALGLSTNGVWDEESLSEYSNHAWNEAFVDNRWITLDTTWDSSNEYINGKFNKGQKKMTYFDISLQYLSATHRIL